MSYKRYEPVDPRDAFAAAAQPASKRAEQTAVASEAESVATSQAAFLLALRAGVMGSAPAAERLREFPLPDLRGFKGTHRVDVATAWQHLGVSRSELQNDKEPDLQQEVSRLVREVYRKPSFYAAAALFEAAMRSPNRLVAAAAAAGARETTRLRPRIRQTLEAAAKSRDRLVSRLALAAIGNIPPMESIVEKKIVKQPTSRKRRRESRTAFITHGTFAANADWYRPRGDFYTALRAKRPDLDVHDRSFRWTGAYSDKARRADAQLLRQWVADQGLQVPDLFAHSHGGTVANLASKSGAKFKRLVLMGWPVHRQWYPEFANVERIIDIRVRMDLVILLDGGGQRFRNGATGIEEHRHGWFDHGSTHEPAYWEEHDLWDAV